MHHDPKWATFNGAYINPNIKFDFQNTLDEPAEDELIHMLGHISLMRDPRASKNMVPAEVSDDLPTDLEEAAKMAAQFVRFSLITLVSDKHKNNDPAIIFTVRGSAPAGSSIGASPSLVRFCLSSPDVQFAATR